MQLDNDIFADQVFLIGDTLRLVDIAAGTSLYPWLKLDYSPARLPEVQDSYSSPIMRSAFQGEVKSPSLDVRGRQHVWLPSLSPSAQALARCPALGCGCYSKTLAQLLTLYVRQLAHCAPIFCYDEGVACSCQRNEATESSTGLAIREHSNHGLCTSYLSVSLSYSKETATVCSGQKRSLRLAYEREGRVSHGNPGLLHVFLLIRLRLITTSVDLFSHVKLNHCRFWKD